MELPSAANDDNAIALGVMEVRAGTPIEALQSETHRISVPIEMMRSGPHYALEVQGDSMIDAGILDGDTAVIQQSDTADNGDIIVALIEDQEATLKRLRRKGDMIALEAANPAYETRLFKSDKCVCRATGRPYSQILSPTLFNITRAGFFAAFYQPAILRVFARK